MKRILTIVSAFAIALGGAAAATAEKPADPGREHGLCTAFFNGQKNGHEKQDQYPGPFQELLDGAGGTVNDLYLWCQAFGIGGNEDNGRWDCTIDDGGTPDDSTDDTADCQPDDNPGPHD